jgi:hypothetical protein
MVRMEKIKLASRCFLCQNRGHSKKNFIKKRKISLFKVQKRTSSPHLQCWTTSILFRKSNTLKRVTLLTYRLSAFGLRDSKGLRSFLLVSGSQSRFIHTSLVDQLQLSIFDKRDVIIIPFEFTTPPIHSRRFLQFILQGL